MPVCHVARLHSIQGPLTHMFQAICSPKAQSLSLGARVFEKMFEVGPSFFFFDVS